MIRNRNILTHKLRTKVRWEKLQNVKFYEALLLSVILVGILSIPIVISSLINSTIIKNSGQISIPNITAKSGYWRDIQEAVDQAITLGISNIYIPTGTYNFVKVGERWTGARVHVPVGINIFGAPTERYANGSVKEWKTVLVLPWDMPGSDPSIPVWFCFGSEYSLGYNSRFSDIKLVGYRSFNPNSTSMHVGVRMANIIDFRIDHCCFLNTAGGGIHATGTSVTNKPITLYTTRGVIDHCEFINTVGRPAPYDTRTVGYGVYVTRGGGYSYQDWETNIANVVGHYLNYTVFVEDCYFEKWRHSVVSRQGAHVVLRHSIIKNDYGYGSADIHGDQPGRALEIYNCIFIDCMQTNWREAVWWRAGGGVVFNNTVSNYDLFLYLVNENLNETFHTKDVWIWNNNLTSGINFVSSSGPVQNVDYFLHTPHTFNYEPYPYPHPLTLKP